MPDQAGERQRTGAYETPPEIVRFLCREALDEYLRERTGLDPETLKWLWHATLDRGPGHRLVPPDVAAALGEALDRVRVLDPAVGTGALLLGMLQEIVRLRGAIEPEQGCDSGPAQPAAVRWTAHALTHSLYGVDINPRAVAICRRRLLGSLDGGLNALGDRAVPLLANLTAHVTVGNSLLSAGRVGDSLPGDGRVGDRRADHGLPHGLAKSLGGELSADCRRFDIVVANPPYVRQERLSAADQESYRRAFTTVHTGTADLLVYFYARAVEALREGGHLAFISSNKFLRAAYGAPLRSYLPRHLQIGRIVDFEDLPVFPVAAYPVILTGRRLRDPDPDAPVKVARPAPVIRHHLAAQKRPINADNVRPALAGLDDLLTGAEIRDYPQRLLRGDGWILEDARLVRLLDRVLTAGTPLREYARGGIRYGIKTGLNEALVVDQAARDALVAADPRSADLIKPWLRGRDIKRWRPEWAERYLIAIRSSGDREANHPWAQARSEAEAQALFRRTYPALHEHLSGFQARLERRADRGRYWWELRACSYYAAFERPKVILPHFLRRASFSYDTQGLYHNNAASLCDAPRPSVVALLNSDLGWFMLATLGTALQNGYTQLFVQFFERFPIPRSVTDGSSAADELDDLVARLGQGASVEESAINEMVGQLYGLTKAEERALADSIQARSRSAH